MSQKKSNGKPAYGPKVINQPLVSIGVPTYNRAPALRRAVESALAQDYQNIELIISDNASTDETEAFCLEICRRDGRVKYVRQRSNQGMFTNFVAVLGQSTGEFFMWLADDDWLDRSYISQCTQKLIENPDYALVCGGAKYYQNGQLLPDQGETIVLLQDCAEERVLAYYNQVHYNSTIYGVMRRGHLHFRLEKVLGGDWLLVAAIAFAGKIETVKTTSVSRSRGGTSQSTKSITAALGISDIHARVPLLSIALAAFKDIAWKSNAYASLGRRARLSLAGRVLSIFSRRFFKPYWRSLAYSYCTRSILVPISVRNKIRKRHSS